MAPLSFTGAEMMAMCLESILYGIYASLFIGGIQTLVQKRATSGLNTRLLAVSIILFVLITWHEVIDTVRLVLAFQQSQTTSGADLYYAQVGSPLSVLTTSVYLLETFVSDLFILYRCYIVWNAYWPVVILPILLFIADCGTGVAAVYTLTLVSNDVIFNEKQEKITNSFFSCTLALNAICTGLIAFRIWWSQYQNREVRLSSNLMHLTIIIVESGAIYLVTLILLVATYSVKAPAFKVLLDIISPIIGIVFSLIIVRVGRGPSSDGTRLDPMSSLAFTGPSTASKQMTRLSRTAFSDSGVGMGETAIALSNFMGANNNSLKRTEVLVDVDIEQSSV